MVKGVEVVRDLSGSTTSELKDLDNLFEIIKNC